MICGVIHSVETTDANVHELSWATDLMHGDKESVFGSADIHGTAKRPGW